MCCCRQSIALAAHFKDGLKLFFLQFKAVPKTVWLAFIIINEFMTCKFLSEFLQARFTFREKKHFIKKRSHESLSKNATKRNESRK